MRAFALCLNLAVASLASAGGVVLADEPAQRDPAARSDAVEDLLARLARPDLRHWHRIQRELVDEWSQSGSPSMDLLLKRGQAALAQGDVDAAIEHLTALTDHAPRFAEGWHARATAFFEAGLYGPALADLERTLALNPNHFGAMTGLGTILEESGHMERALRVYEAAHALHPHHPRIAEALERAARAVGDRDT